MPRRTLNPPQIWVSNPRHARTTNSYKVDMLYMPHLKHPTQGSISYSEGLLAGLYICSLIAFHNFRQYSKNSLGDVYFA